MTQLGPLFFVFTEYLVSSERSMFVYTILAIYLKLDYYHEQPAKL